MADLLTRYVIVDGATGRRIQGREEFLVYENGTVVEEGTIPWWDTRTGHIVRFAIGAAFFVGFFLFIILGRFHAKRRLRAGKIPWKIHAWLLTVEERATYDERFRNPQINYIQPVPNQYPLQAYPPPTYAPNTTFYTPPTGDIKTESSQWKDEGVQRPGSGSSDSAPAYSPPPGPPPAAAGNPYRL